MIRLFILNYTMNKYIFMMISKNVHISLVTGFSLLSGVHLQAATQAFAFGSGIGAPVSFGNEGNSFNTGVLTGGGGQADTPHGSITSGLGGQFDGTPTTGQTGGGIFNPNVSSDPTLTTRLNGQPEGVNGGLANNLLNNISSSNFLAENFIGFHVQFDNPAELFEFAKLDYDGVNATREWGAAWGYNSVTGTIITPTISLAGTTLLDTFNIDSDLSVDGVSSGFQSLNSTVAGGVVGTLPDFIPSAYLTSNLPNADPDDFAHQAIFDFGGQEVTDLYFAFGSQGNTSLQGGRNSGLTGFIVTVPEPSSALLCVLSLGFMSLRRRR